MDSLAILLIWIHFRSLGSIQRCRMNINKTTKTTKLNHTTYPLYIDIVGHRSIISANKVLNKLLQVFKTHTHTPPPTSPSPLTTLAYLCWCSWSCGSIDRVLIRSKYNSIIGNRHSSIDVHRIRCHIVFCFKWKPTIEKCICISFGRVQMQSWRKPNHHGIFHNPEGCSDELWINANVLWPHGSECDARV